MSDPYIGEIRAVAFNFAPYDWATCDGQLVQIQQNTALFSILGTTFGGNGTSTFGLPNLMGQVPVGCGSGQGLTPREWGEPVGAASVSLLMSDFPSHTHGLDVVSNANADKTDVATHYLSKGGNPGRTFMATNSYQQLPTAGTQLGADAVQVAGTATQPIPHNNMQPYLPVLLCIALYGVWPTRP